MPASDRAREIRFALLLLVPIGIGIAVGEVLVRQRNAQIETMQVDWSAMREAAARRTSDGSLRFQPGAVYGPVRFNQIGLRGPDVPVPLPVNTVRIAFVGDSKVFAADQVEASTLPARTIALLARRYPNCRFDYLNISGPGFSPGQLAGLWTKAAAPAQPSMAVILAGSATDQLAPEGAIAVNSDEGLFRHSALLRLVRRELLMLSPVAPRGEAAVAPLPVLKARYHASLAPLRGAVGSTPAIAIGYRSRAARDRQVAGVQFGAPLFEARHLRQQVPGLSLSRARAVMALVLTGMRDEATAAGWQFIDPLADLHTDPANFIDRSHFSPTGNARLAVAVADAAAGLTSPDCKVPPIGRKP